jgi:hypothetical protein
MFLTVLVILIIGAIKIIPLCTKAVCDLLTTFLTSKAKDQADMIGIIKSELADHREESSRQFALNERMVKGVEGSLESLRELTARTASMDHRFFEGLTEMGKSNASDHKDMSEDLATIKGFIQGLS